MYSGSGNRAVVKAMNRRMSVVLSMSALVLLLITQPSTTMVFARHHGGSSNSGGGTGYAGGLDAGTSAAQSDNPNFDNTKSVSDCLNQGTTYTVAYCQGFVKGYYDTENSLRSSAGSGSAGRLSNPQQPQQSGQNWIDTCNKISFALVSPCSVLVNPDNTLTSQGMHVRDCIENGALLAGWCSSFRDSANCSSFSFTCGCKAWRV